mmetsp:Transcript_60643/g.177273  ORF Transcript_60643/g.177273 Transcript_60643/m.177273 type:complete len:87 (-) Transcript_60643:124-384(-)
MFMFHRLLSLVTMMYNEQDELTVCDFIRQKDRAKIQVARQRRAEEEAARQDQESAASATAAPYSPQGPAPEGVRTGAGSAGMLSTA